ncbi:MAG: aminotransferase class I/II-fold pyridoxal phosphate-dependent enzyme [Planctomycetes bacterium]|nr:aminotransferase class I/II-fold pyridoxal phosphate-dependent enzyme [Planctomycetota bacterium]
MPEFKMRESFLPFSKPVIEEDEIAEVVESLRSGWITTGPKVQRFEKMFVDRLGAKNAIAVNSATGGLHIVLHALGLKPEDEVIVPSLTWASTANVVELAGAKTVFCDVSRSTGNIDVEDAKRRITKQTRAIIPVHYTGQPADMDAVYALAKERGIVVIEDAAHAVGTKYKGREIGTFGDIVVFSFHPIKNITTGEGGMVIARDDAFADRLRLLRFHGVSKDAWKRYEKGGVPQFEVIEPGYKYNMLDLQAALGLHQLPKLERFIGRRTEIAELYGKLLADVPGIDPLGFEDYENKHAWHLYIVALDLAKVKLTRNEFMQKLQEINIGTGLHFPALHTQEYYRGRYHHKRGDLPNAEYLGERIMSLPLHPLLSDEDVHDVANALRHLVQKHACP